MAGLFGEQVAVRVYFTGSTSLGPGAQGQGFTDTEIVNRTVTVGNGVEIGATHFSYTTQGAVGGVDGDITVDITDAGYTLTFSGTANPYGLTIVLSSLTDQSIATVDTAVQTGFTSLSNTETGKAPNITSSSIVTSGINMSGFQTGASSSQTVTLTFSASTNTAPTASNDAQSVFENATASGALLANDDDDGGSANLIISHAGSGSTASQNVAGSGNTSIAGTYGTLILVANGDYSYSPNNEDANALASGATAVDVFTYEAKDAGGLTDTATVTFNITGVNDAPVVTGAVSGTATEDGATSTLNALGNASDVDAGAVLSVTALPATLPAGVTYNADAKTFSLDPKNAAFQSLAAGASTTVTVNYKVSDGTAQTDASVQWTVSGTNDAPVIDLEGALSAEINNSAEFVELGTTTLAPELVLSDVDGSTLRSASVMLSGAQPGDILSYGDANGLSATVTTADGTITLTFSSATGVPLSTYEAALRTVTFSSTSSEPGTARSISWSVNDGQAVNAVSASATTTLQITSFEIDQEVVVSASEGDTAGGTLSFTVTRTGDISRSQTLSVRSIGGEGNGMATVDNDFTVPETVTFAAGSATAMVVVAISPDRAVETDETVTIGLFRDDEATTAVATASGTIVNDDAAGTFSIANLTVNEGTGDVRTYTFTVTRTGGTGDAIVGVTALDGGNTPGSVAATQGSDYQLITPTLVFADGANSATGQFTVASDNAPEPNEQFRLQLMSSTAGATFVRNTAVVTIVDNDNPGGTGGGTPTPTPPPTTEPTPTPTPAPGQGTDGNYVLISTNTGNSTLSGGNGNDTYLVYSMGDLVIDGVDQGTDILYTTVSYNMGENQIEAISVAQQTTTDPINLIGNYVSQTIVGNYGNNILNGGGGADTLIGLFGDDTYAVGDSRILVQEQAGQGNDTLVTSVDYRLGAGVSIETFAAQDAASTTGLRLTGNELAQTVAGTAGADTIGGGGGRDVLIGGAGADTFLMETVGSGNVAVLADFVSGTDRIGLTSTAFNVGTSLDASEFIAGTAATTADQRVIYDAGTGQLFYDADGNGAGAAVLFAQVVPGTAITAASFDVIVPTATAA